MKNGTRLFGKRKARGLCLLAVLALLVPLFAGWLPALSAEASEPAWTAEAIYPGPPADVSICGTDTGALQMQPSDVVAMQVVLTGDARTIFTSVPSYSNSTGSATMALFRFDTDYDTTLLGTPIAEHTFVDFADSAALTFRFSDDDPLPAGEYLLLLYDMEDKTPGEGNGTGIGLWQKTAHAGQRAYLNGSYMSDRTFSLVVDYIGSPQLGYGTPTKPASGPVDYAPHMGAVLNFGTEDAMALVGRGNESATEHKTAGDTGFLRLTASAGAGDPYQYLNLPEVTVLCSEYKFALLKARRSAGSELGAQLFYITADGEISEAASVRWSYADSADWQYIILNLGASGGYDGVLESLRLDYFLSAPGQAAHLDLAYIALFKSEEAARAFHDNFEDFSTPEGPEGPGESAPDLGTYTGADAPGTAVPGKLTENGQLGYLYKESTYEMDFSAPLSDYISAGDFAFAGTDNALVRDGMLYCRAFAGYTLYTRRVLGDKYGIRGGSLSLDLVLEKGSVSFTVRQILPGDELDGSGLRFELTRDGQLTVSDRDGFSDRADLGLDLTARHTLGVQDTGNSISLMVDGKAAYTLTWDAATATLTTADGRSHRSPHLPNAGYAAFHSEKTRGQVDNVRYTYTDIQPKAVTGNHTVDLSTWVATDDLGRTTPEASEAREEKQVGLFYFLIHSDSFSGRYVNDVTRFYLEGGTALVAEKLSSFAGRNGAYWAEPYFGYYSSHDEWVYRKHAYMLEAAGVDFIFLDVSNRMYYLEQATVLFDTWLSIRREGGETPQIAFMFGDMPLTLLDGLRTLLGPIYDNPDYRELLYCVDGKPLILGNSDTPDGRTWTVSDTTPQTREYYKEALRKDGELMDFYRNKYASALTRFTVRKCWAWQAGTHKGYWDWLQESPQDPGTDPDGNVEQMAVALGVHAHTSRGRSYLAGNNQYNPGGNFGFGLGTAKYGRFFEEQFEYAIKSDVRTILITGWNEWYAGVQQGGGAGQLSGQTPTPNYYMVDQMSPEYSRDAEPMKLRDGEGFGDNFYYQMAAYIRRFKGMDKAPATVNGGAMATADAAAWGAVAPAFTDMVGDADLRHALSFAAEFLYVNGTARNDLGEAKVSQDADSLYFRITTVQPLITVDDEWWMNLYIDADSNAATGWEGFDFVLNRSRTDRTVSVERFVDGGWVFEAVGEADYILGEDSLVIAVQKSLLGHEGEGAMSCRFKWADNADVRGDVMRFMTEGDAAPNDRFVFAYTASTVADEIPDADIGTTPGPDTAGDTPGSTSGCRSALAMPAVMMIVVGGAVLGRRPLPCCARRPRQKLKKGS